MMRMLIVTFKDESKYSDEDSLQNLPNEEGKEEALFQSRQVVE